MYQIKLGRGLHIKVKDNILLSICIPAFNRDDYLKNTLDSIVNQAKFPASCEVIISDNNSTDNTRAIGEYFSRKYSNVRYYRNETNIGAESNFLKLLNYGQGKYLKLHNDRACFYKDKLDELVKDIENSDHDVIFLLNENRGKQLEVGLIECNNFDQFVQTVSYWSTWMCGIILKNEEYRNLKCKDRAIASQLIQTDIMFRMLADCRSSLIINEKMLYEQALEAKGGYNLFKVFIGNYLGLYQDYLKDGTLSRKSYKKEKINLLRNFIFPWYTQIVLIKDKRFQFDTINAHHAILKRYWNEPFLYSYPLYLMKISLLRILQKINFS